MLIDSLRKHARERPGDPALLLSPNANVESGRDVLTWFQLSTQVNRTATELSRRCSDASPTFVAHVVENIWPDIVLGLACQVAGLIEAPIDCGGGAPYIQSCRSDLESCPDANVLWIDEAEKSSIMRGMSADMPHATPLPLDDALVLWTGGTTEESKSVVLSQASLHSNAAAKLRAVPQSTTDTRLTLLSISHAYARTSDIGTWLLSGCRLAIARGLAGWEAFAGLKPTLVNAVPSLADRLIDCEPDSLRAVGCGGAAMTEDAFSAWTGRGATVIQGYGLTETGPVICSQTPDTSVPLRVGNFVEGWEHRIEHSRLFVRGPHLMSRYLNNPEATRAIFDARGWLDTGDLVHWDDHCQQLEILGRDGDRITLSNGYTVDPVAIENRYSALDGVRTAIVVRAADTRRVELWIEWRSSERVDVSPITRSLARWQQPSVTHEFSLPAHLREQWTNRKGILRRQPVIDWLEQTSF